MKTWITLALGIVVLGAAAASERPESVRRWKQACEGLGLPSSNVLVGFATSMEKILQRETPGASMPAQAKSWLSEARAALAVPESLVKTMNDYSRDPAQIYAWRNRMGDLIDRSGMPDVNPWGPNFTVRGFRAAPK